MSISNQNTKEVREVKYLNCYNTQNLSSETEGGNGDIDTLMPVFKSLLTDEPLYTIYTNSQNGLWTLIMVYYAIRFRNHGI